MLLGITVNNIRRYLFLVLILMIAGGISWWSARSEAGVVHRVQEELDKLVPQFISDPSSLQQFVVDPILESALVSSLQHVVLTVTGGDDLTYGDGSATHVALFEVDHQQIAGLRIICESETGPLVIAGVFPGTLQEANTQ
jgi:hypothetical protein